MAGDTVVPLSEGDLRRIYAKLNAQDTIICMPYGRNRCAQDQYLCGFLLLSSEPVFRIGHVAPAQCGSSPGAQSSSGISSSSPCDWSGAARRRRGEARRKPFNPGWVR
jgi:hypothetical protein